MSETIAHRADFDHHRGAKPLLRPGHPWRTGIMIFINALAFLLVNSFWAYVSTGKWTDFSAAAYYRDLGTPIGAALLFPLNLLHYPWMILVAGLILGLVIFVPVTVAVLYRQAFAFLFVAMVALIGHAPVLALSLAIGCVLAARTRLRSDAPFGAVLLGLLPVGIYLCLFSLAGSDGWALQATRRWLLYAPIAVSLLSAVVAAIAVLTLARLTAYRPGVVWPVLVVLLAAPLVVFYLKIGPAELDYALITAGRSASQSLLEPISVKKWNRLNAQRDADGDSLPPITMDISTRREQLIQKCRRFLENHPASHRSAEILYVLGQAESLRLDLPSYRSGMIQCTSDYVMPSSRYAWQQLVERFPQSPQAAIACWKLGVLAAREGDMKVAHQLLTLGTTRLAELAEVKAEQPDGQHDDHLFAEPPTQPTAEWYDNARMEARKLLWMIEVSHAVNDSQSAEALAAFLKLDPRQADYTVNVHELVGEYEASPMGDLLKLAYARTESDIYCRKAMLQALVIDPRSPAAVAAWFELGLLAIQEPASDEADNTPTPPQTYFQMVLAAPPNPWQQLTAQQMRWLKPPATTATTPARK